MFEEIWKEIEKIDKSYYEMGKSGVFAISHRLKDLDELLRYFYKYFELDKILKDKRHDDFDYPNEGDFYRQKHKMMNYICFLLMTIKDFIPLAFKFSVLFNKEDLDKNNLSFDAIVNMVDNFVGLRRTGRKRKFYEWDLEKINKFKKKHKKVIEFYRKYKENKGVKSLMDTANFIRSKGMKLEELKQYIEDYKLNLEKRIWDCSKRTLYRYDKDLILIRNSSYLISLLMDHWMTYESIWERDLDKKVSTNL